MTTPPPPAKYNGLGAPDCFSLDQACHFVGMALGETCYLVGSATTRRDFRDVDVRVVMDDAKWLALFGGGSGQHAPFWSLLCTSVSEYLSRRTGLKVDFQVQRRSNVLQADWKCPRIPVGLFMTDRDPAWVGIERTTA